MIRTRFAPSPTGYMHLGNLRTALYEYLIAKKDGGTFILRIEDTDQNRYVEGAVEAIYNTLKLTGLQHDEGPDVGGDYGPYVQSERKSNYIDYAKELIEKGEAYYCFCTKERLETLVDTEKDIMKYDRHCEKLSKEEVEENLKNNIPFVIRQKIRKGEISFDDEVYGKVTVNTEELDDQILIKSDGLPTYNFANVIDDHLMKITHVVRGSEYLSSTPKYNLLYEAFGWEIPIYVHLPLILNQSGDKLSKRRGDASFEDLINEGYLPEAIVNYISLLGCSPGSNEEIFSLEELVKIFDAKHISKSPSAFDTAKLNWVNAEYIKKMDKDEFFSNVESLLKENVKSDIDLKFLASFLQSRVTLFKDVVPLVDFVDTLDDYSTELFIHKKMKTNEEVAKTSLEAILPIIESVEDFTLDNIHELVFEKIAEMGIKNGQMLWPIRTALSGKPTSPCGGIDLFVILGKEESIRRIKVAIEKL
ncbi:MAG: glutamate--tRNA ligase [Lachnospirales bacterium]